MPEPEWQPSVTSLAALLRLVELNATGLQAEGVTVSGAIYDDWKAVLEALYFAVFTHPFDDGQALELASGVPFHRLGYRYPETSNPGGARRIFLVLHLAAGEVLLVDIVVDVAMRVTLECRDPLGALVEIPSAEIDRVRLVEFRPVSVNSEWRTIAPSQVAE